MFACVCGGQYLSIGMNVCICMPYTSLWMCVSVYAHMHVYVYVSPIPEKFFILGLKYQIVIHGFGELFLWAMYLSHVLYSGSLFLLSNSSYQHG